MRLSLRSGQTHFVPASCRRLSADSRLPWHLTWSIALFGSCTAWDLPAAWAARGAARDRPVLPDAGVPPGPLARVAGAAPPVAHGAPRRLAPPVGHPHVGLVLRPLALPEPDVGDLPLVPGPRRPLEGPCRHACPSIHIAPPGRSLQSGEALPFGGHALKGRRSATHQK